VRHLPVDHGLAVALVDRRIDNLAAPIEAVMEQRPAGAEDRQRNEAGRERYPALSRERPALFRRAHAVPGPRREPSRARQSRRRTRRTGRTRADRGRTSGSARARTRVAGLPSGPPAAAPSSVLAGSRRLSRRSRAALAGLAGRDAGRGSPRRTASSPRSRTVSAARSGT